MEENKPATKKDLIELSDAILNGISEMISNLKVELKKEIRENRRNISNLKLDKPTRKEFEELRSRVDRYHPLTWPNN